MMKKTTAKDRKTYPTFVFVISKADKIIESTWTTNNSVVSIIELARINANSVEGAICTVWQKTEEYNNMGKPIYMKTFTVSTQQSSFNPQIGIVEPIEGFLRGQTFAFDSSKWRENKKEPIRLFDELY